MVCSCSGGGSGVRQQQLLLLLLLLLQMGCLLIHSPRLGMSLRTGRVSSCRGGGGGNAHLQRLLLLLLLLCLKHSALCLAGAMHESNEAFSGSPVILCFGLLTV